ncbi:hypothetical protein ACFQX7_15855 [Luedemannella flava]
MRERVGAGGIVGLGCALTGAPSALTWHAAGTRLLALPALAVAEHVRPHGESLSVALATAGETEALLASAPSLAALTYEDRLGLAASARPVSLSPGIRSCSATPRPPSSSPPACWSCPAAPPTGGAP